MRIVWQPDILNRDNIPSELAYQAPSSFGPDHFQLNGGASGNYCRLIVDNLFADSSDKSSQNCRIETNTFLGSKVWLLSFPPHAFNRIFTREIISGVGRYLGEGGEYHQLTGQDFWITSVVDIL